MQSSVQRKEDSPNYLCEGEPLPLKKKILGLQWIVLRNDSWGGISMGENAKEYQELVDKEGKTQNS